jgi:very-short-patch-repair endonuclease
MKKKISFTEQIVIDILQGEQIGFRHQQIIGFYIVDFFIPNKLLVIEIDGRIHNRPDRVTHDKLKDNFLKSKGLEVLRIKNEDVGKVLRELRKYDIIPDHINKWLVAKGNAEKEQQKYESKWKKKIKSKYRNKKTLEKPRGIKNKIVQSSKQHLI